MTWLHGEFVFGWLRDPHTGGVRRWQRKQCIAARRRWFRFKRRGHNGMDDIPAVEYRLAKRSFRAAIRKAKVRRWQD